MYYRVELLSKLSSHQAQKLSLFDEQHQLIGYATGEFRQYTRWFDGQLHFFLDELVITRPTQSLQLLGSQLLKAVEAFARTKGASWIRGQMGLKSAGYVDNPADERSLRHFWGLNGYGSKREIYEDAIRFWKPLQAVNRARKQASSPRA